MADINKLFLTNSFPEKIIPSWFENPDETWFGKVWTNWFGFEANCCRFCCVSWPVWGPKLLEIVLTTESPAVPMNSQIIFWSKQMWENDSQCFEDNLQTLVLVKLVDLFENFVHGSNYTWLRSSKTISVIFQPEMLIVRADSLGKIILTLRPFPASPWRRWERRGWTGGARGGGRTSPCCCGLREAGRVARPVQDPCTACQETRDTPLHWFTIGRLMV